MKFAALLALGLLGALTLRADDPATFPVGSLTFKRPTNWAWVPVNSPMRKAQLKVPGAKADESAEITFFHFGPDSGGGVEANAQRWVNQFHGNENAAKIETQDIGGAKVTVVSTEGTYMSGMPGGPVTALDNYALLGAIIEQPDGNVFVKMTGPAALVKSFHKKFLDFIATALPGK
jgi:hypothetical protein